MKLGFADIGQVAVTMAAEEGVKAGMAVSVKSAGTVGICGDGVGVCGVALSAEDGAAAVQVKGFVTVGYSGGAPSLGMVKLSGDGTGKVKTDDTAGTAALVVEVDEGASTALICL